MSDPRPPTLTGITSLIGAALMGRYRGQLNAMHTEGHWVRGLQERITLSFPDETYTITVEREKR